MKGWLLSNKKKVYCLLTMGVAKLAVFGLLLCL